MPNDFAVALLTNFALTTMYVEPREVHTYHIPLHFFRNLGRKCVQRNRVRSFVRSPSHNLARIGISVPHDL